MMDSKQRGGERREREANGAPYKSTTDEIDKLESFKVVRQKDYRIPPRKEIIQYFVDTDIQVYAYRHMYKMITVNQIPVRALRPGQSYYDIAKNIQEVYQEEFQNFYTKARAKGKRPLGQGFKYYDEAPGYGYVEPKNPGTKNVEPLIQGFNNMKIKTENSSKVAAGPSSRAGPARYAVGMRDETESYLSGQYSESGTSASRMAGTGPAERRTDFRGTNYPNGSGDGRGNRGRGRMGAGPRGGSTRRSVSRREREAIEDRNRRAGLPAPEGTRRTKKKNYNGLGYQVCDDGYLDHCASMNVKDDESFDGSALADGVAEADVANLNDLNDYDELEFSP